MVTVLLLDRAAVTENCDGGDDNDDDDDDDDGDDKPTNSRHKADQHRGSHRNHLHLPVANQILLGCLLLAPREGAIYPYPQRDD